MEQKALFLDFDGVLFDTLLEVYLVNRYLYKGIDLFDEINIDNYNLFSKYKFLVYNIWMFYYYNPLIFDNIDENKIISTYNNKIIKRDTEKEIAFCEKFIASRKKLVENHYDFWQKLEKPFDFFFNIKKLSEEKNPNIYIVSKKNKTAIIERFNSYGYQINKNNVFAREILDKYKNKGEFLNEFMNKNNIAKAIFVDDNNNNINSCKNYTNITSLLALWGNPEPNSVGYTQQDATKRINDFFNN